jgi:hypothetical protein
MTNRHQTFTRENSAMSDQDGLIAQVEREILDWPGVHKEFRPSPVGDAVIYWLGERQLGHIHLDGVADLQFPRAVHDELIAAGRARPHRGGFAAVVSYAIRRPEDVRGAIDLFRLSYERLSAAAAARAERRGAA